MVSALHFEPHLLPRPLSEELLRMLDGDERVRDLTRPASPRSSAESKSTETSDAAQAAQTKRLRSSGEGVENKMAYNTDACV